MFDPDGEGERVHMSDEQHAVLEIVVSLFSKSGPMTLKKVALIRKRSVVSTYLIMKKLRRDKLVEHKLKIGGQRASGGSISPTKLGIKIINSKELPGWRDLKK